MTQALILVDIQNDYFPSGTMELVAMTEAATRAASVLQSFRDAQKPLFHIQHLSVREGATFFVPDTPGAEHHELVAPRSGEAVIQKNFPNSFRETSLVDDLRAANISDVVIAGAMSHMCIDATTRAAFDFGFQCTVIEDACATRDLEFNGETIPAAKVHASFMSALSAPYATVTSTTDFLQP